jgi:hypothetical protein
VRRPVSLLWQQTRVARRFRRHLRGRKSLIAATGTLSWASTALRA